MIEVIVSQARKEVDGREVGSCEGVLHGVPLIQTTACLSSSPSRKPQEEFVAPTC
jgi:hypothetical protein